MSLYSVRFTKAAIAEWESLRNSGNVSQFTRVQTIVKWLAQDPFSDELPLVMLPHPFDGVIARRIDSQTLIVYEAQKETRRVKVLSVAMKLPTA